MKNNIRLVSGEAPSGLLQEHSPARLRLAGLINDELSIRARMRDLGDAASKLREAQDAEVNAAAALAGLDNEEASTMSSWAKQSSGPMPTFDQSRREKLKAAADAAAAQAAAARKAMAANGSEQERELVALKALEPEFAITIATVLAESVEPLLNDYEAANKALASKAERIQQAFVTIRGLAESLGNQAAARPVYVINERLHERIRTISDRAAPTGENHSAAWMSLAAELRRDPTAEFKS